MADESASGGLSGYVEGNTHLLPIRIHYHDTDFSGIVHHSNYFVFCEKARGEALRLQGIDHAYLTREADEPVAFAIRRLNAEFLRPARMDDLLIIKTKIVTVKGARLEIHQDVTLEGVSIMTLEVLLVIIDPNGKPRAIPKSLVEKLSPYTSQ